MHGRRLLDNGAMEIAKYWVTKPRTRVERWMAEQDFVDKIEQFANSLKRRRDVIVSDFEGHTLAFDAVC